MVESWRKFQQITNLDIFCNKRPKILEGHFIICGGGGVLAWLLISVTNNNNNNNNFKKCREIRKCPT
jgi:hypothetical protein